MKKYLWSIPFLFLTAWAIADLLNLGGYLNLVSEPNVNTGAPTYSNILIDATGEKFAFVFPVIGTKIFRRFGFRTGAITTGDTLDVRLETAGQAQTTGMPPSGTLACSNSSGTFVLAVGDANSYKETGNLASDCTVTNSTVAVVINNPLGNFNGNFNSFTFEREDYNVIYTSNSSAGWAVQVQGPLMTAVDSNSNFINLIGIVSMSNITGTNFLSSTNPNTRGNLINLPFTHRIIGVRYNASMAQPMTLKLWNSDGATVLESVYISSGISVNATFKGFITFSQGYIFPANTPYRITFTPVSGTNNTAFYHYSWANQTIMNNLVSMGPYIYLSTGNNPTQESSWTQNTLSRATIYPVIDQIDVTPNQNKIFDSTLYDTTLK